MARGEITGRKPDVSADQVEHDSGSSDPPRLALSIPEFCTAFSISEDFFYKLKRQDKAPRLMKVGARTLISLAAADEWRREREAASKVDSKPAA